MPSSSNRLGFPERGGIGLSLTGRFDRFGRDAVVAPTLAQAYGYA
jgi:hypothetical protein